MITFYHIMFINKISLFSNYVGVDKALLKTDMCVMSTAIFVLGMLGTWNSANVSCCSRFVSKEIS